MTVAEAGIADLLLDGPRSVSALAAATGLDADALGRMLRVLASLGIFAENGDGEYINTRLSETLARSAAISMHDLAVLGNTPSWVGGSARSPRPFGRRAPRRSSWRTACRSSSICLPIRTRRRSSRAR